MNYNKSYGAHHQTQDASVENSEIDRVMIGFVANCNKLNVREEPDVDASVVCVVTEGAELMINESGSTEEFYKIYTEAGVEGFCMKKYVAPQQ